MGESAVVFLPAKKDTDLTALCNFACQYGNYVCVQDNGDSEPSCGWYLEFGSLSDLVAA